MKKGLPKKPGWYWVKHASILGAKPRLEPKYVRRWHGRLSFFMETMNHTGYVSCELLANVEWYGPIPKPEES